MNRKVRGPQDAPKEPVRPAYANAAEEVLTSLLRARSIVWLDPKTGKYVYRSVGCAFGFLDYGKK